ncbi:hypothetical protein KKJ09_21985, partial [Xenorhabdus bovienii]|uniref:hypothetical protein n=1 Tax=Xenorhabdus bovienii TaxID=40576 RepID=UPI0023B26C97
VGCSFISGFIAALTLRAPMSFADSRLISLADFKSGTLFRFSESRSYLSSSLRWSPEQPFCIHPFG